MYEEELAGKIRAHKESLAHGQANYQTQGCAGLTGEIRAGRSGLRERVKDQLQGTHRALRKAQLLEELSTLLAKHPDVARILDPLEETSS